jgi:hypothetical protein
MVQISNCRNCINNRMLDNNTVTAQQAT